MTARDPIDELMRDGALHCVYQPLVALSSSATVAHEALLRGPAGTSWASPVDLLRAAGATGRLAALEEHSLLIALGDAARHAPTTVFVNVEPVTLVGDLDMVLATLATRAPGVQVVVEVTERAFAADPAGILTAVERLRAAGHAIALDDVGVEPESLAFIPVLQPEAVKLDLSLLRSVDDPQTVLVAGAVRAYASTSGASVVAEGVETEHDLTRAFVLGATLGQGWWWGRPDRTFRPCVHTPDQFAPTRLAHATDATMFSLLAAGHPVHRASRSELGAICRTLEAAAYHSSMPPMLLSSFSSARDLTPDVVDRYNELAGRLPLVAVLAPQVPSALAVDVRAVTLVAGDPAASHTVVVVLGAHEAVALSVRPATGGLFEFVVTHDRPVITSAAWLLLSRLAV